MINEIGLGIEQGDDKSSRLAELVHPRFNNLCSRYCSKLYTDAVQDIMFVLRISGDLIDFEFEGCDAVDLDLEDNLIGVDIGIPVRVWENLSNEGFLKLVVSYVSEAADLIVDELISRKCEIDSKTFIRDLNIVCTKILEGV